MKDITKQQELEYAVLSHLVQFADHTKRLIDIAAIEESAFSGDSLRAAFCTLIQDADTDPSVRLATARRSLPELGSDEFLDYFVGLAPSKATTNYCVRELLEHVVNRDLARTLTDIAARSAALSPEVVMSAYAEAQKTAKDRYESARDALATVADASGDAPAAKSDAAAICKTDEALLDMPGFVNELVAYTLRTAHRPNRVLAFAGALAFLAHLAGRKFVGPRDAFPNLYVIALAESAAGKDHPRKVNKRLASHVHMSQSVISNVASGQGLEDALLRTPALLCQFDEYDSVLRELKSERPGSASTEALWRTLLTVFTSSSTTYSTRVKAAGQNRSQGGEEIEKPSFSMFATAISSNFYGALSQRALGGGLLGRCLVFEAGPRGNENFDSGLEGQAIPYPLARKIEELAAMPPAFGEKGPISPRVVRFDAGAAAEIARVAKEVDALYDAADGDVVETSVWGRSVEHVGKLSLLHAISADIREPSISAQSVAWAWRLVKALQLRMLEMARDYAAVNEREEKVLAALRAIRKAGRKGVMRTSLTRSIHALKDEMDRIEETLVDRGEITVEHPPCANGKGTRYRIRKGGRK
jgi:hypothetical protein